MDWRQLELLRCVVEHGGFGPAAAAAGVSQPAVSQAMRRLALQVPQPLFERRGRRQVPTAHAIQLAQAMRAADEGLRATQARPAPAGAKENTIRVGLAPAAGLLYGPTMVQTLAEADQGARLSISTGAAPTMVDALRRGELDLVIAPRPRGLDDADLCEHLMYLSQPLIFCRDGHPLASATSLRAITRAKWVVAGQAGTPGNVVEEAFRVRRWAPPDIAVQCADYAMLVHIVAHSDLLGVVSHPSLVPQPRRLGLVPIRVGDGLPHYEVCLFWPRHRMQEDAAVRRIVDALTNTVPTETLVKHAAARGVKHSTIR